MTAMRLFLLAVLLIAPSSCGVEEAQAGSPQTPRVARGRAGRPSIGVGGGVLPAGSAAISAPTISMLSSSSVVPGDSVTITGTGMASVSSVTHRGYAWTITGQNSTTVTATVAEAPAFIGALTVTNPAGSVMSSNVTLSNGWYEFSDATIPPGVTIARTGDAALLQTGTSTASAAAANTVLYEDRGAGLGSLPWTFPSYTNLVAPFDLGASPWAVTGTISKSSPGGLVGPDGATAAERVVDADAGGQAAYYYYGGGGSSANRTHSWWAKAPPTGAASPPGGVLCYPLATNQGAGLQFPSGLSWTRQSWWGIGDLLYRITPAGYTPETGDTYNETGAMDLTGYQLVNAVHDYPLLVGTGAANATTGGQTIQLATTNLVRGGSLDIEHKMVTHLAGISVMDPGDATWWYGTGADGEASVRYSAAARQVIFKVKGSDVLTVTIGGLGLVKTLSYRAWYRPSQSDAGLVVSVNGVVDAAGQTAGVISSGALASLSSSYLGSTAGASAFMSAQHHSFRSRAGASPALVAAEAMVLGDSTCASYLGTTNSWATYYSATESLTRPGVISLCVVGNTVAQQKTAYNASSYKGSSAVLAVFVMLGWNDIITSGSDGATLQAALEDLVATIKAGNPSAKIVLLQITPGFGYTGATITAPMQAAWNSVNSWISACSISNVDACVTSHRAALEVSSGVLKPRMDRLDGLHFNNLGRDPIGAAARVAAQSIALP